jgi:hypothetical protein
MTLKLDTKGFLTDKQAGELVDLVYSKLGLNLRGFINDQDARDRMRLMSLEAECKKAREGMGITIKEAAQQIKVQQFCIKSIEGGPGRDVTREALDKYIDFLGIRAWFDTWIQANRDVYKRLKSESPKRLKKA